MMMVMDNCRMGANMAKSLDLQAGVESFRESAVLAAHCLSWAENGEWVRPEVSKVAFQTLAVQTLIMSKQVIDEPCYEEFEGLAKLLCGDDKRVVRVEEEVVGINAE